MTEIKLPRRLDLSVQYACNREGLPLRADFVRWARATLVGGGEITRFSGVQRFVAQAT